jgi:hypothetical protein
MIYQKKEKKQSLKKKRNFVERKRREAREAKK